MASLQSSSPAASHLIGVPRRRFTGFQQPLFSFTAPAGRHNLQRAHVNLEALPSMLGASAKFEGNVQRKKRWSPIFASSGKPSEKPAITKTSDNAQGPPFLTILAGLVVFLVICWLMGSIVMWLVGLIAHPPPLK